MAPKRNLKELEKDYCRIRSIVTTKSVTTLKEIADELELSVSEVNTSLARHPRGKAKIMKKLEMNKSKLKSDFATSQEEETIEVKSDYEKEFVIDASIVGIEDFEEFITKLLDAKEKIVITSVTIKELEKLQKFNDTEARDARHLLALAVENQDKFVAVLIDENEETPDDCIVKYCAKNKEKVVLLTSDKTMVLKARMYGVQVEYHKQRINNSDTGEKIVTLYAVRKLANRLVLLEPKSENKSLLVISNGIEYADEMRELLIGDEIYIATRKINHISFTHFKIVALEEEDNSELIYSCRIYSKEQIYSLPKASYKSFIKNFITF